MTAFIRRIEIALLVACMTVGAQCASAQADAAKDYPSKPITNTSVPAKSVAELITYAKSKSPGIVWATVGAGSPTFLATELFRRQAGFDGVHVPYNASQVALTDLVGGRIELMFVNMPGAMSFIRGNRIRTIGIAAPTRSALLPDVPTIAELGLPGFQSVGYAGVAAPAKVPRSIIDKLNAEMVRALKLPEVQERIQNLGGEPRSSSPDEFKQLLEDEIGRWAPVAREAGVKLER